MPVRHFKMWPFRYFGSVFFQADDSDVMLTGALGALDYIQLLKIPLVSCEFTPLDLSLEGAHLVH